MRREAIFQFIVRTIRMLADVETIQESDELIGELGISSMDILTLMSYLEEEFDIRITEKMIRKVATVGDLVDLVCSILEK